LVLNCIKRGDYQGEREEEEEEEEGKKRRRE
jgi:hypothetical protein